MAALYEIRIVALPELDAGPLISRGAHDVVLLLASGLCLWGAARAGRERAAWLLIGLGVLGWSLGEIYYTAVLWDDSSPPVPSPGDAGYLLFSVLALVGVVLLSRSRWRGAPRTLWGTARSPRFAVAAACAAIVLETVLETVGGETLAVATGLAYPLVDLVLLAVIVGSVAGSGWNWDRRWVLLATGVLTFGLADSLASSRPRMASTSRADGSTPAGGPG